jgi:hypothetical protein
LFPSWSRRSPGNEKSPPPSGQGAFDQASVLMEVDRLALRIFSQACQMNMAAGAASNRSNCKGPIGIPCAVTPQGTRPPCRTYPIHAVSSELVRIAPPFCLHRCVFDEERVMPNATRTNRRMIPSSGRRRLQVSEARLERPRRVLQCDQTTVCASLRIVCSEEVGQSYQGRVRFVLRVRLQHGNNLDCSSGAFSAWGRGLGIFAVAALTRLPNDTYTCRLILFAGCPEEDWLRT